MIQIDDAQILDLQLTINKAHIICRRNEILVQF